MKRLFVFAICCTTLLLQTACNSSQSGIFGIAIKGSASHVGSLRIELNGVSEEIAVLPGSTIYQIGRPVEEFLNSNDIDIERSETRLDASSGPDRHCILIELEDDSFKLESNARGISTKILGPLDLGPQLNWRAFCD